MGCGYDSGTLDTVDGVRAKYDVVDAIGRGTGPLDDDTTDWVTKAGCSGDAVDVIGKGVEPLNGDEMDRVTRAVRGCGTGT